MDAPAPTLPTNPMASALRGLIAQGGVLAMPGCFDALSACLVEQAGFRASFLSGFAASAARIGQPDLGLMSYSEVLDQARNITDTVSIPLIADADTGYGNAMNVRRTVQGFARAGCAGILIEDQCTPKRCGHTPGKEVVSRDEAFDRIRAAVEVREACGDILILARTDARHTHGLDEAIERARTFHALGADILFVEAPKSLEEMQRICDQVPGCKLANMVEGGLTPILSPEALGRIGYQIAIYPLTLLSAAMKAMVGVLEQMRGNGTQDAMLLEFGELRRRIGFDRYYDQAAQYASARRDQAADPRGESEN